MSDAASGASPLSWSNLGLNVLGGLLAAFAFALCVWGRRALWHRVIKRRARRFFGNDSLDGALHLVYSEWELRPDCLHPEKSPEFPYRKPGETGYMMKTSRVLPLCDARAIGYLASELAKFSGKTAPVTSDVSIRQRLDKSFVSYGLGSNHKTRDLLSNPSNELFDFDFESNTLSLGGDGVTCEQGFDYGVIAKIRPQQFPNRVWIACAGLGEWGTSAAAWYLANKWSELYAAAKGKPFAALLRVRPDQDESPELVGVITSKQPSKVSA
jgi:hypothetical protein